MKKISKLRKELRAWLKIPKIIIENKSLKQELKDVKNELEQIKDNDNKELKEMTTLVEFYKVNNDKLNEQVIALNKKIEKQEIKDE